MAEFTIHDIPHDVWQQLRGRAGRERWHLQGLFRQLAADYASGHIGSLSREAPPMPWNGVKDERCPHCGNAVTISLKKTDWETVLKDQAVPCPLCRKPIQLTDQELQSLDSWAKTATRDGKPTTR
jgi:hypothetical protein